MTPGGKSAPDFTWPAALSESVRHLPDATQVWVALSGGLDSVLLLHVVSRLCSADRTVRAIHVNHQLQTNADDVERFCRTLCESLNVPLYVERVTVGAHTGSLAGGVEEAAPAMPVMACSNGFCRPTTCC